MFNNIPEFSVVELATNIKKTLEQSFGHIRLRGEISGYRGPHASGHCYFSLKDDKAKVDAVVWRGVFSKLKFKPEEGLEVIVTGKVSSYPGSSKYQIVIEALEPAGAGALMALLEERKKKLATEGLFAEERKKPLPFLPRVVGIITSPTGAVIRDMMHGFTERFPAHVIVWPVRVQGETSALEVTKAVNGFNALTEHSHVPRPDLLIVARGGGSLEDLWGFNEENVARAVATSTIPVISAVGHETDWTIIDLVADARAPTPTKAAEWAVPKYRDLVNRLSELELRLHNTIKRRLEDYNTQLTGLKRALPKPTDLLALPRQRLDFASNRLPPALRLLTQNAKGTLNQCISRLKPSLRNTLNHKKMALVTMGGRFAPVLNKSIQGKHIQFQRISSRFRPQNLTDNIKQGQDKIQTLTHRSRHAIASHISRWKEKLKSNNKLLSTLSYKSVLNRGFALVRNAQGEMVRTSQTAPLGEHINIEFSDGNITARTENIASKPKKDDNEKILLKKTAVSKKLPNQGSLF